MAIPAVAAPQTDFSAGEIDSTAKRDSKNPIVQAGVRQATNFRILNTKGMENRFGRRALFRESDRVEEVVMAPGVSYFIAFPNADLNIYDSTGAPVFTDTARPWTAATAKDVVWAVYEKSIYVTFAGMTPRILTWDGVNTWTAADFAEQVLGTQNRTIFYRIAPKGITLSPSALTGAISITFSANVLVSGMIGTRIRYNGRQMTITSVTSGTLGGATVNEALVSNRQNITASWFGPVPVVGDVITGQNGAVGVVVVAGAPFTVELSSGVRFASGFIFNGSTFGTISAVADAAPAGSVVWDQEVMNSFQGWPKSVFVDQNRLGFCNFPAVPRGIAWSAVAAFDDFYPDAFAADGLSTDSIFELVPDKSLVQHIVPGMDGSEFVFCDNHLYYIAITAANPLRPGSVAFSTISDDECANVQPRRAGEFIIYVTGGLNQLRVVKIFGAYTRAYTTDDLTEFSGHLFDNIKAISIMTASASFAERYAFVLNSNGTVIVGKYTIGKNNELQGAIGWTPWTGSGTVQWASVKGSNILF